jgi:hypothetical protein
MFAYFLDPVATNGVNESTTCAKPKQVLAFAGAVSYVGTVRKLEMSSSNKVPVPSATIVEKLVSGYDQTLLCGMLKSGWPFLPVIEPPSIRGCPEPIHSLVWEHACYHSLADHRRAVLERTSTLFCEVQSGNGISGHVKAAIAGPQSFVIIGVVDGGAACTSAAAVIGQRFSPAQCFTELQVSRAVRIKYLICASSSLCTRFQISSAATSGICCCKAEQSAAPTCFRATLVTARALYEHCDDAEIEILTVEKYSSNTVALSCKQKRHSQLYEVTIEGSGDSGGHSLKVCESVAAPLRVLRTVLFNAEDMMDLQDAHGGTLQTSCTTDTLSVTRFVDAFERARAAWTRSVEEFVNHTTHMGSVVLDPHILRSAQVATLSTGSRRPSTDFDVVVRGVATQAVGSPPADRGDEGTESHCSELYGLREGAASDSAGGGSVCILYPLRMHFDHAAMFCKRRRVGIHPAGHAVRSIPRPVQEDAATVLDCNANWLDAGCNMEPPSAATHNEEQRAVARTPSDRASNSLVTACTSGTSRFCRTATDSLREDDSPMPAGIVDRRLNKSESIIPADGTAIAGPLSCVRGTVAGAVLSAEVTMCVWHVLRWVLAWAAICSTAPKHRTPCPHIVATIVRADSDRPGSISGLRAGKLCSIAAGSTRSCTGESSRNTGDVTCRLLHFLDLLTPEGSRYAIVSADAFLSPEGCYTVVTAAIAAATRVVSRAHATEYNAFNNLWKVQNQPGLCLVTALNSRNAVVHGTLVSAILSICAVLCFVATVASVFAIRYLCVPLMDECGSCAATSAKFPRPTDKKFHVAVSEPFKGVISSVPTLENFGRRARIFPAQSALAPLVRLHVTRSVRLHGVTLTSLCMKAFLRLLALLAVVSVPVALARGDLDVTTWSKPKQGLEVQGALGGDDLGIQVSGVGDVNHDGYYDLLVGADKADLPGKVDAGAAYLLFGAPSRLTSTIDTSGAVSPKGIKILGGYVNDNTGQYVSGAGDFNHDNIDDFIVGVPQFSPFSRTTAGAAVVIFGKTTGWTDINLASFASGSAGFWIMGAAAGDELGHAVAAAGDMNGDGIGDVAVGAHKADQLGRADAGTTYVIFGHSTATSFNTVDLLTFSSGSSGFKVYGAVAADRSGDRIRGGGDFNDDGFDDVLIGAYQFDFSSRTNSGAVYVIFGHSTTTAFTDIDLAALSSSRGFSIAGAVANDRLGWCVSSAGDFNGDGYDDIVIGNTASKAYFLFGHSAATAFPNIDLAAFTVGAGGFIVSGPASFRDASGGVDVNGDGMGDVVLGVPTVETAFVLYGRSSGSFANMDVTSGIPSNMGFRILGVGLGSFGNSVGVIVDFDGDAGGDIVVGANTAFPDGRFSGGAAYLIYSDLPAPTSQPSRQPTGRPSRQPTSRPSRQPSSSPTSQPSQRPSSQPSRQPSGRPTSQPSQTSTTQPTSQPSRLPSSQPSVQPTGHPTGQPSRQPAPLPSGQPSSPPTSQPSRQPSPRPSTQPTSQPSSLPSKQPTSLPSKQPTAQPSAEPTSRPSDRPSSQPSSQPSCLPTFQSSGQPSSQPSGQSTVLPSMQPSNRPSAQPTRQPSSTPSVKPTHRPTDVPSAQPSGYPTAQPWNQPTSQPSGVPSTQPSVRPTEQPTARPSRMPSSQPSTLPTSRPSGYPSCQPTAQPSTQPGAVPTYQPSTQPTDLPSTQPTVFPSSLPSSQPTDQPSHAPTSQPSSVPTGIPTLHPTEQPVSAPTSQPTLQPSASPSALPTGQPTHCPSSLPSCQPSSKPSTQPSRRPSTQPTRQPTAVPTSCPTYTPSSCPTVQPSSQPSATPTAQHSQDPTNQPSPSPTNQPVSQPSTQPTQQPAGNPTQRPSTQPSSSPSAQPTRQPSGIPSGQPSHYPTGQPSCLPSAQPTSQPATLPSRLPSSQPTQQPTYRPSQQPTGQPSTLPTQQLTCYPTTQPSAQPYGQPSRQPTSAPTKVIVTPVTLKCSVSIENTGSTFATVEVKLHGARDGNVRLYPVQNVQGDAQADINRLAALQDAGHSVSITGQTTATVHVSRLLPLTDYDIYCAATASLRVTMPLSSVLATKQPLRTLCCKVIKVVVQHPAITHVGQELLRAIAVALDAAPSVSVVVTLQYNNQDQDSVGAQLLPTVLHYSNRSTAGAGNDVRLTAVVAGNYTLLASVSGPSAAEYRIEYSDRRRLTVLPAYATPSVPRLSRAAFSNDGSYVTFSFDSATDRANRYGTFSCSTLLQFSGSSTSHCEWHSDSQLRVYSTAVEANVVLGVGVNVTLLENTVRARCTDAAARCASYVPVAPATVAVAAPSAPTVPIVVISAPSAISGCNSLTLDLAGSVGAAGRPWSTVSFAISTTPASVPAANRLLLFFSRNYTLSPPLPAPSTVLVKGYMYNIKVTLCNFLKACASATKVVLVGESLAPVPVVTIAGQSVRTVYRTDPVGVEAGAYTQSCSGSKSSIGLQFSWAITQLLPGATSYVNSTLRSTSQNPAVFKLSAYTLSVGATYTLRVTALSTLSGQLSSAALQLQVVQSDLVAVLKGGSTRYATVGEVITLDASNSYDKDYPQQALSRTGVSYTWHCVTVAPTLSADCVVGLVEASSSAINVTSTYTALNTTTVVSVTVSDASRSSTTQARIIILHAPTSRLVISGVGPADNVNTGKPFTLLGTLYLLTPCAATWSVDDPTVNLATAARTAVQQFVSPTAVASSIPINLVIKSDALPQRATLQFTLSCGNSAVSTVVTTNGAPLPGSFSVKPESGVEVLTAFTFSAAQWFDPDLPLTYQFGFQAAISLSNLVIVSRSELSYAVGSLPVGDANRANAVSCNLRVFDSLVAFTDMTTAVQVGPQDDTERATQLVLELLKSSADSVRGVKSALAVGSSVINAVNCTTTPSCAPLNRQPCRRTSGQCGACLDGFVGDAGDRNTLCLALTASPVELATAKSCAVNCTGHGQCTFVNKVTGITVPKCTLAEIDCDAVCDCVDNYSGEFCEVDPVTLRRRREVRSNLIQSLSNLTAQEDINTESVAAWSANLYALSIRPHEVSQVDAAVLADIANTTLHHAIALGVDSYADMLGVLQATDAVASLQRYNYNPNDYRDADFNTSRSYINNTAAQFIPVVSAFGDMVRNVMVLGENQTTLAYDNFRMTVALAVGRRVEELRSVPAREQQDVTAASSVALQAVTDAVVPAVAIKVMSTNPRSYALDTSDYVSSPVRLQVQALGSEQSNPAEYLSSIEFTFQHNALQTQYTHYVQRNFTSTCKALNASQTFTYHCPGSEYMIRHNCSRGAGVHVSYCPKPAAACAMIALETAEITAPSACTVLNSTATHTTCRCTVSAGDGAEKRRSLATTERQILDATGATDLLVTTVYIASDFADTFKAAGASNNATLSSVLVVVLLLGSVWVAGLGVLGVEWALHWWYPAKPKIAKDSDGVHSILAYIDGVIPKVFERGTSSVRRLVMEVTEHHVLFQLVTADTPAERWFLMVQALTELTLLFFLTAAFFDISQPGDDGTCPRYTAEHGCLKRTSPFDHSQTYCRWTEVGVDTSQGWCMYNNQTMSITALFYMTVLTTVISSVVSIPIEYQFGTLKAPTALSLEGSKVSAVVGTVVSGARRVSNAGLTFFKPARVAPTPSPPPSPMSTSSRGTSFRFLQPTDGVVANREIPASIAQASTAARASLGIIGRNASTMALGAEGASRALRSRSTRVARRSTTASGGSKLVKRDGAGIRLAEPTVISTAGADDEGAELLLQDIVHQRVLMNSSAKETKLYDAEWGVLSGTTADYMICSEAADGIRGAVKDSTVEASRLDKMLNNYSLQHAGLEMLHLFMLDLLGRNTVAAKVFREKFGEEFGHSRTVVELQKYFAAAALLALNAFFIYFVMIKGLQKGRDWQVRYVTCCLIQVGVDILLFETIECAWLNFLVPQYVHEEVANAADKLRSLTQRIAGLRTDIEEAQPEQEVTKFFLNAPAHLFVSTKLAERKPQLLESMIVSSYRHHLPGEICKTWPHYCVGEDSQRTTQVRSWLSLLRWALRGLTLSLQLFVGVPFAYQKVALRFAQPIVFSGLALIIYAIFTSVVGLVAIGACVFAAVLYAVRRWCVADRHATSAVNPGVGDAEEPTFISEASSSDDSADLSSEEFESEEEEDSEEIEFWEVGYDDESDSATTNSDGGSPAELGVASNDGSDDEELNGGELDDDRTASGESENSVLRGSGDTEEHSVTRSSGSESAELHSELQVTGINSDTEGAPSSEPVSWDEGSDAEHTGSDHESHGSQDTLQSLQLQPEEGDTEEDVGSWGQGNSSEEEQAHRDDGSDRSMQELHSPLREPWSSGTEDASGSWEHESGSGGELRYGDDDSSGSYGDDEW